MKNIEVFNQHAAFFLGRLYESFPSPCLLDCSEAAHGRALVGTGADGAIHRDDLQRASSDQAIVTASHALKWLSETGYFTAQPRIHWIQADNAVLTAKGFEALNSVPASISGKGTLGRQLVDASKSLGSEAGSAAVSSVVSQVVAIGLRLFGPAG